MTTLMTPAPDVMHAGSESSSRPDAPTCGHSTEQRPLPGWQMSRTAALPDRTDAASQADEPAVDLMALLGRCLGNFELIMRVLARFRNSGGADLEQLAFAVARNDFAAVIDIAHRFKGASGNVSAARLHKIAAALEEFGRDQNAEPLPGLIAQLRTEWDGFLRFADAFAPPCTTPDNSGGDMPQQDSNK